MPTKRVIKDIPDAELETVIEDLKSEGCEITDKKKQEDGNWTVTAMCPN